MSQEPRYFECLHCGTITILEDTTPKCSKCGHGTGVIHATKPERNGKPAGKNDEPAKPNRFEAASAPMLALRAGVEYFFSQLTDRAALLQAATLVTPLPAAPTRSGFPPRG